MSNLTKNTQQLEALLAKINALPEAGSGGTDTSDATATADEIFAGETAYTADGKVTGTFTIENELTEQTDLISQITNLVATKATPSGTDTNDATATASDILSGKTAYVKGSKITGTIATKTSSNLTASGATVTVPAGYYAAQATKSVTTATQATPSVSINSSGLITASATQSAGYVSAGTKSGTKQLTTKGATTYTPGTSNQTIASSTYLTGTQTIKGDANLKAENIASGVSIFGVAGTHAGGTAEDLDAELTVQENFISQLSTILDNKASGGGSVETCTVTISDDQNCGKARIICTVLDSNGEINGICRHAVNLPQTINNIICGSAVYVENISLLYPTDIISEDCILIDCQNAYGVAFRAPSISGAVSSVIIKNNY